MTCSSTPQPGPPAIGRRPPSGACSPPGVDLDRLRAALEPLPEGPTDPAVVVRDLADAVEPALVATSGPRYFGFVVGGALDAATAADVLAVGWDQPAFNVLTSPGAAVVEEVAGGWLQRPARPPGHRRRWGS